MKILKLTALFSGVLLCSCSDDYAAINALQDKGHPFAEPAFTLRAGWKNIKLQFQASYVANLNSPTLFFGEEAHISFGLYFTLANRLKRESLIKVTP